MSKTLNYAIIDIESTGGKPKDERIIEIAIYRFDGHDITDQLICLINPERPIQDFVQKLTNITDGMVKRAPKFHEVAKRIVKITDSCLIVAHNADFDYRILRKEFKLLGYDYQRDTLCTVKLSKKLLPDVESHSLGKLCKSLGIPLNNRHRADGDAFATLKLFELLLEKDVEKNIVSQQIQDAQTIINKDKVSELVSNTPEVTGVFYIHNQNGKILYMGKSKNIRQSIAQFLANKTKKVYAIIRKMTFISYDETGSFVLARLLFNQKINILKPRYNNLKYLKIDQRVEFESPNLILIDKARHTNEKSIILIRQNELIGYGYFDLDYQITNQNILKQLLVPLSNTNINRHIIKSCIDKNRFKQVITLMNE